MEQRYPGYDQYRYNVGEIGHSPVELVSYLSVLQENGIFQFNDGLKDALDSLFAEQYTLSVDTFTEEQTTTRTVHAGESLGTVVTSAYCNCPICCGQWSGGPTASGVYPTSNHTLAVDAHNPTVPMGTEIIMNGTLYKVEDTGNFARYGVDFDVYMDSHSEAQNWGHRSFEAYLAGGDGEELDVYLLGVDRPVGSADCRVIGAVHRKNDVEDKLIASPDGIFFTEKEMHEAVRFQEQWYDTEIEVCAPDKSPVS